MIQQLLYGITVQKLLVGFNDFKAAGIIKIARAIQKTSELHINTNSITEEVGYDVAAVIRNNCKLQVLCLGGNDFTLKWPV